MIGRVRLSESAEGDILEIFERNESEYGFEHAKEYELGLFEFLEGIEKGMVVVRKLDEFGGVQCALFKWRRKRGSHGHLVFLRESDSWLEVIRILHTARDWPAVLGRIIEN